MLQLCHLNNSLLWTIETLLVVLVVIFGYINAAGTDNSRYNSTNTEMYVQLSNMLMVSERCLCVNPLYLDSNALYRITAVGRNYFLPKALNKHTPLSVQ